MDVGFSQLIWAIIFVIFLVITALKNRARMKTGPTRKQSRGKTVRRRERGEPLSNFLEEIFGIEEPERGPKVQKRKQQIKAGEKKPRAKQKRVEPKPKERKKIGEFTYSLAERSKEATKPPHPKKDERVLKKRPWETKSNKDLQDAIVFAEIVGPPIAKRKNHRLF